MWETLEIPPPLDLGPHVGQVAVRFSREDLPRVPADTLPDSLKRAAPLRQVEWALGRHCAHQAGRKLGVEVPPDLPRGEDRAPIWPAGLVGSLTHKDGLVVAAVARRGEIRGLGIDTERIIPAKTLAEIAKTIANPAERELAARYAASIDRETFLSLLFSAKESLYKCLYPSVRKFFSYHEAEIEAVDVAAGTFRARLGVDLSPDFPSGRVLNGIFRIEATSVHTALVIRTNSHH